jgi:tetratricopeptide (TPR) repeat protein
MIPKEGSNRFAGDGVALHSNRHFQSENNDAELRAKGLLVKAVAAASSVGTRVALLAAALFLALAPRAAAQTAPITFSKDVAPILFEHCASCHRPDGSASFSLLTFPDARPRARQLADVTAVRAMPPWQPEPGHGDFSGARRLSDGQIRVFRAWFEQGALEGDPALLPPTPRWTSAWQLGEPDLVLTMPAYTLRAVGPDRFRNFVLPVPTTVARHVRAWEFRPGNPRVVHHATMQIDRSGRSRHFDEQDGESGYEGLIAPSARAPDGFFLDWAPGHRPQEAVEGTAWPLPAASDLVMMLHLRPSGKDEAVQASIGLYFSARPPERLPVMLRLTRQRLDIPSGERRYEVTDAYTLPVDVDVHTVQPHAHYLAREMRGYAQLPDKTVKPLIFIRAWDFDWQDVYRYTAPVFLPAGTTIRMEYTYDNSAANRRNPNRPPRRVTYGQQTSDEMAELWFQVVARTDADRATLKASLLEKVLPEEIAGRRMMLVADPKNVALRDDLAVMLAETGDLAAAVAEFSKTLQLVPESAAAAYNVGSGLAALGRASEARGYFEKALTADPNHALSHFQLAAILRSTGNLEASLNHYRSASRLGRNDAEIQLGAGLALVEAGDRAESDALIRRSLELEPEWPNAQAANAWLLAVTADATAEERARAVRLAERAASATRGGNAGILDALATALASDGQFERAVATARRALTLAASANDAPQVASIRARLMLFEKGRPYREAR